MATITAVKLYLEKGSQYTEESVSVGIKTGVTSSPPSSIVGSVAVSKLLLSGDLPPNGFPAWTTFTFDDPLTITENGFYGVYLNVGGIYIGDKIRVYEASDWTEAGDLPYTGQEKAFTGGGANYTAHYGDPGFAYEILTTGVTSNGATTPSGNYVSRAGATGVAIGSYLEPTPVPTKATTPAPANAANDVTLDQAELTWVDGGGATSYNVYYGDTSGALTLVSSGQAELSHIVTGVTLGSPYDYAITRYWRIDSINAVGTTEGDEWSFTTISFDQLRISYVLITGGSGAGPYDTPPGVEGTDWRYTGENNLVTLRRLVSAANNKIWIEEI